MTDKKKLHWNLIYARKDAVRFALFCLVLAAMVALLLTRIYSPSFTKSVAQVCVVVLTALTATFIALGVSYTVRKRKAEKNFRRAFGHDHPRNDTERNFVKPAVYAVLQKLAKDFDAACKEESEFLSVGIYKDCSQELQLRRLRVIEAKVQGTKQAFWFAHRAASLFALAPYPNYKDYLFDYKDYLRRF